MLKPEQNQALMEVGPGTLMGDLLRWYWTPFAATAEMDTQPTKAVRLMGEGLVLYKDGSGNYVDKSAFPSLQGDLALDWSFTAGAKVSPTVAGINNIGLDIGGAITSFLLPVIKPFYDATSGMKDVINFLTSPVPIISDFLRLGLLPPIVVQQFLPTYTSGETLDWLHFSLDMLVMFSAKLGKPARLELAA